MVRDDLRDDFAILMHESRAASSRLLQHCIASHRSSLTSKAMHA